MNRIQAIALTLLFTAAVYGQGSGNSEEGSEQAGTMSPPEAPVAEEAMMSDTVPGGMMMSAGSKVDFTDLESARMIAAAAPTVLFFHAGWCPLCRADMQQIDSRLHELGNIVVVVVDYDRNPGLKKKYGVTYQHTYVQIDGDGEQIALWSGGGVDGILKNVVRGGM